jgi:hypothetical protein
MLLQANGTVMFIVFLLIASVLLWLMLYFASSLIIGKTYASNKKLVLLIAAIILVLVVPLITGVIGTILNAVGGLFAGIRNLIDGQGSNYVGALVPIINFLLFMVVLKFICGMDRWDHVLWISLIALFFLFILYSLIPELVQFGSVL